MILQCLNVCLKVSLFLGLPSLHPLLYSFLLFVFEADKRQAGYRYCCHMLLNEKALLSKQMGFLNIETAACLFNMTVLNLPLFHHFDKLPTHLLSLSTSTFAIFFSPPRFHFNLKSLKGTSALRRRSRLTHYATVQFAFFSFF